ncbi:hypothetical protein KR009_009016, partial [Drosophila setifemur]
GVGKTTLVRKISKKLLEKRSLRGFYTEEVRGGGGGGAEGGQRIGFDVVTLAGKRGILARVQPGDRLRRPKVGNYSVYVQDFEDLALPELLPEGELVIIDEVGRMELFSKRFESAIGELLQQKITLLVTVPEKKSNLPLVEQLKKWPGVISVHVMKANRDSLVQRVVDLIENDLL